MGWVNQAFGPGPRLSAALLRSFGKVKSIPSSKHNSQTHRHRLPV